jgi:hypothetical protein
VSTVEAVPSLVTLHVWGVPRRHVPAAALATARDRRALHRQPGLTFAKLLGTGAGRTFTPADADPRHWGVLACWRSAASAASFERSALVDSWDRRREERLRVSMVPLSSKGCWSGRRPFGEPTPQPYDGPVAALTRARIRPTMWRTFWRSVPAVAEDLSRRRGLVLRLGIGEAPVGLQGTFSVWSTTDALRGFAYSGAAHAAAIMRTRELGWYSEELFARFAVLAVEGTHAGTAVDLGGT